MLNMMIEEYGFELFGKTDYTQCYGYYKEVAFRDVKPSSPGNNSLHSMNVKKLKSCHM